MSTRNGAAPDFTRTPPHDLAAEMAVLGGMMQSRDALADVAAVLAPADHYRPAHQIIHEAIVALDAAGEPADWVAVTNALGKRGTLSRAGGIPYVHDCLQAVPVAASAGYYARIVADKAILRRQIEAGTRIVQMAHEGAGEAAELAERARQEVDAILPAPANAPRTMATLLASVLGKLETKAERGLSTGIIDLDRLTGGLAPGELVLIGARPSVGKSVLLKDIAVHVSMTLGLPALFSSLEMSAEEITLRVISGRGRVLLRHLTHNEMQDRDWDQLAKVTGEIANSPLVIDDSPGTGLSQIRAQLRTMARVDPARLLLVDYLGLLTPPKADNRQAEVAALSRGLKLIAREFAIPVVAAAQLNRGPEHRADKRPQLAELRESGAQEQDADVVILLHREDANDRESARAGEIDLDVAKNRQGPKATITAAFQGHYARIVDMAPDWSPSSALERAA